MLRSTETEWWMRPRNQQSALQTSTHTWGWHRIIQPCGLLFLTVLGTKYRALELARQALS